MSDIKNYNVSNLTRNINSLTYSELYSLAVQIAVRITSDDRSAESISALEANKIAQAMLSASYAWDAIYNDV